MFKGIFNKRRAEKESKSSEPVPSSSPPPAQSSLPVTPLQLDEAMLVISRELSGLAELPVSQAARERGWASVQRELERHPVRTSVAGAHPRRAVRTRSRRWAIASAAAAVAVVATIAALLVAYSGDSPQVVDNGGRTTTVTSVVSPDTTEPSTTASTDGTTVSSDVPGTTQSSATAGVQPGTTEFTPTTGDAQPSTTATTRDSPGTTGGGGPTTTQPSTPTTPTTTSEQQLASLQREGSAQTVVASLGQMVTSGNTSGARALVAPEAQSLLAQMMMSLNDPHGYRITGVQSLSDTIVRVTLEISDRVVSPNDELKEALPKFAIKVRVDDKGAVITAINAG